MDSPTKRPRKPRRHNVTRSEAEAMVRMAASGRYDTRSIMAAFDLSAAPVCRVLSRGGLVPTTSRGLRTGFWKRKEVVIKGFPAIVDDLVLEEIKQEKLRADLDRIQSLLEDNKQTTKVEQPKADTGLSEGVPPWLRTLGVLVLGGLVGLLASLLVGRLG